MEPSQPVSGDRSPAGPWSLRWRHNRLALIDLALSLGSAVGLVAVLQWLDSMPGAPDPGSGQETPAMQLVYVISMLPAIGGAIFSVLAVRQAGRLGVETLGPAYTAVVTVAVLSLTWLLLELFELQFVFADCVRTRGCSYEAMAPMMKWLRL